MKRDIVTTLGARHEAAETIYNALTKEVEVVLANDDVDFRIDRIERIAHAYSMVSGSEHGVHADKGRRLRLL